MTSGQSSPSPSSDRPPSSAATPGSEPPPENPEASRSPDAEKSPEVENQEPEKSQEATAAQPPSKAAPTSGPLAGRGPLAARGLGVAKPASPASAHRFASPPSGAAGGKSQAASQPRGAQAKPAESSGQQERGEGATEPPHAGEAPPQDEPAAAPPPPAAPQRVSVPSKRDPLSDDLLSELEAELASADVEAILKGNAGMPARRGELEEGQRIQGTVLKLDRDSVFISLGGPDEGVVPAEQFKEEPAVGQTVEVVVRGLSREDNLYVLVLPGETLDVSDWDDLDDGAVVEANITAANTGGLECTVGNLRGFIPISQISEYRVEDPAEFVGQRMSCVVTECNPRRRNLVLSRRAVLEREREGRRREQLERIQEGDTMEGVVRSVKDFGAFVDLGGLEGLIHISKLSWDRIKHPSEVIEEGQKVQVKVEKIDRQTGKIGLSYRDLMEHPWDAAEENFPVGSIVKGVVSRIANFGAFVRLAAGIEGLIHISELAHHRVFKVDNVVKEGEEIEVKVLSFDRETQRMSLSLKAAQAAAAPVEKEGESTEEVEPPREPAIKPQHRGPLRGGTEKRGDGERFGLRW